MAVKPERTEFIAVIYQSSNGGQLVDIFQFTDTHSLLSRFPSTSLVGNNRAIINKQIEVEKGQFVINTGLAVLVRDELPKNFKPFTIQHTLF